ncbi:MAG: protease modulator HflC [Burkholderiaceae bacterium]|nr:protease modulator HflC [Burkholderiaceae bacterium]MCD6674541.1 protease modulator HflC [Burkholderiaceae bacterium]
MQKIVPAVIGLLIAIFVLMSCVFVVDQRQFAVVYALGEIRKVIDAPGLYFKLPPPFQNVVYYDKRILTIDTSESDRFITSEKLNVMIDTFVKWRIIDPPSFIRSVSGSEQIAVDRINRSLRDALNNEIARRTVSDMISSARDQVVENVRAKVNDDSKQIGVEVIDVRLKRVDFAPEVSERVFARMESERKQVANERRATGAAESEKIRAEADRQREVIVAEAYREAQQMRGEGDARVAQLFAAAWGRNPQFAAFYRSLEAYRQAFGSKSDVLVLDPSSEFFRYFKAPDGSPK